MRFCCGSLPQFTPVFFPLSGKKKRLAISCVPIPQVEIATRAFSWRWRGYLPLWVHFGFGRLFAAISTGLPGTLGYGGWRRGLCALLRKRFGLAMLSAGSTLGLNVEAALRPLWTLLTLRRGYVGAYTRRPQAAKNRVNTRGAVWKPHCGWPGGSCCIAIISTRTIGDLPDSDLWSGRSCIIARQQVEAGTAGRVNTRGAEWPRALPAGFAIFYCFASCNLREIAV